MKQTKHNMESALYDINSHAEPYKAQFRRCASAVPN